MQGLKGIDVDVLLMVNTKLVAKRLCRPTTTQLERVQLHVTRTLHGAPILILKRTMQVLHKVLKEGDNYVYVECMYPNEYVFYKKIAKFLENMSVVHD